MSNRRLRQAQNRGMETPKFWYSCEIEIDGKRTAWSRPFFDQRAAMLDAMMLLIGGSQSLRGVDEMERKSAELTIFEHGGGRPQRHAIARARFAHVENHEPVVEMLPAERR